MMGAQAEDSHSLEDQRTAAFTGKSEISLQRTGFRIRFAANGFCEADPWQQNGAVPCGFLPLMTCAPRAAVFVVCCWFSMYEVMCFAQKLDTLSVLSYT